MGGSTAAAENNAKTDELMNIPNWAWWTFGLSLLLVLLFLLLDWLLIRRRNGIGSGALCLTFRHPPGGKYGYASPNGCGIGMGGNGDWQGGGQGGAGSLGAAGGQGSYGHHKRSTNLILSV